MVKTRQGFVLATTFLSGIAVVLSITSLATEEWISAQGEFKNNPSSDPLSTIKYGLFSGTFWQILGSTTTIFELSMTCIIEENACAYICESSAELRKEQLKKLLRGEYVVFNPYCPKVRRLNDYQTVLGETRAADKYEFINAGLYISTIVFLSISVIFGLISTILSLYNTLSNPIEVYFSISGLYIYNTIACITCLLSLSLWSALFGAMLFDNVAILYTIQGQMSSQGLAYLGYSFWILLPSCLLYPTSIGILFIRQYLIDQEPEIKIHTTPGETDVGDIMIY